MTDLVQPKGNNQKKESGELLKNVSRPMFFGLTDNQAPYLNLHEKARARNF